MHSAKRRAVENAKTKIKWFWAIAVRFRQQKKENTTIERRSNEYPDQASDSIGQIDNEWKIKIETE